MALGIIETTTDGYRLSLENGFRAVVSDEGAVWQLHIVDPIDGEFQIHEVDKAEETDATSWAAAVLGRELGVQVELVFA